MAEVTRLENQLSQLTEQLSKLNITTKEQFNRSKLGANYNPFSSAFAAPSYANPVYLDGNQENAIRLSKVKGIFNPFTHNRLDESSETSALSYVSPQDRVRSDTNEVSAAGRKAEGIAGAGAGMLGASMGSTFGQIAGAGVASKLVGGKMGLALSTLLPGIGMFAGGALGATLGASAFGALSGSNQRVAANAVHQYMMENSFKFLNPNQSEGTTNPMGSGFGYEESRELSRSIPLLTDDLKLNSKTLMELTKSFSEGDMMKGINTTKEFTDRFKDLTETAKSMAYLLNESVEDAGKFMSDLQLRGFDMTKLTNQTAKMKNLSQFLGKDVTEVAQTAVAHASNNVAGTNMNFTTALENQTYTTRVMNEISDSYLKRGDNTYKAAYDLIKNMNGPEEAASVFGKVMNSAFLGDHGIQDQVLMASSTYDPDSDSWSFDPGKFSKFNEQDFSLNDGHQYAQRELIQEFTRKKRQKDPTFESTPDLIYQEFFANRQRVVGSMDMSQQGAVLQASVDAIRKEAPDKLKHMSDKTILQNSMFQFDETTAEMAVAVMRKSSENFANEYENSGRMAEFVAGEKANNVGFVGKIKQLGSSFGNQVAGVGMEATAPIQNLFERMTKMGSDYLFGNKDFDYQKEFGIKDDVLKEYFSDESGDIDATKIGKNFYETFEKGLRDAQRKGTVVSTILLEEVSAIAKSAVKRTSAGEVLSGEEYTVQRWLSDDGLSDYAKQNYNLIQQTAVSNNISDQALAYVGSTQNMTPELLKEAAPELQKYMEAYGGNETLAIAAFERGGDVVDKALEAAQVDIEGARERNDFTEFNQNENVTELSKTYAAEMEKSSGVKSVEWQGTDRSIQSKNSAFTTGKDTEDSKENNRTLLMGAIELTRGGLPRADSESVVNARLDILGIEYTKDMTKQDKEAALYVTEGSYKENFKELEYYTKWGASKDYLKIPEEERRETVNAYISHLAGKDTLTKHEAEAFDILISNPEGVIQGMPIKGSAVVGSTEDGATVNSLITSSSYDEINPASIKELEKAARDEDVKIQSDAIRAQWDAKILVDNVDFGDASSADKAEKKRQLMLALSSGDQAQLDIAMKELDLTDFQKQEFARLGALKVGDTGLSLLSIDPDAYATKNQDRVQTVAAKTKFDHDSAKLLLGDLGLSKEYIDSVSLTQDQIETVSLSAVAANKDFLIDLGATAISAFSDEELTELLNSGSFDETEITALTKDDGGGMNPVVINKDGSFSLNKNLSAKEAATVIAGYGMEQFRPGFTGEEDEETKGQEAKEGLTDAATDLIATMESTTGVMIDGTDKLIKRQEELARKLDLNIPIVHSSGSKSSGN